MYRCEHFFFQWRDVMMPSLLTCQLYCSTVVKAYWYHIRWTHPLFSDWDSNLANTLLMKFLSIMMICIWGWHAHNYYWLLDQCKNEIITILLQWGFYYVPKWSYNKLIMMLWPDFPHRSFLILLTRWCDCQLLVGKVSNILLRRKDWNHG